MDSLPNLLAAIILLAFFFGVFFFAASLVRLEKAIQRLEDSALTVAGIEATVDRMEAKDAVVADGRTTIADNLADSRTRADASDGDSGAAADAAVRNVVQNDD